MIDKLTEAVAKLTPAEKLRLARLFETEGKKIANLIEFPAQSKQHYKEWMELDQVYERAEKAQSKFKTAVSLGSTILSTLIKAALS